MKYDDLINYINKFINDSFKLPEDSWASLDVIDDDYRILKNSNSEDEKYELAKDIYSKIKIVEFKYGGDYAAVKNIPQYKGLIDTIDYLDQVEDVDTRLKKLEQIDNAKYEIIRDVPKLDDIDIKTSANINSDVLYSINSIFEKSKNVLSNEELYSLCINYFELKKNSHALDKVSKNLEKISDKVWANSLTDPTTFKNGDSFNFLIHNFTTGDTIEKQISNMSEFRKGRVSCSLITDSFIGIYNGDYGRRAGFIYPSDSKVIMSGKHDLYSIESGNSKTVKNKEFASSVISPQFLEDVGKKFTSIKGEDFDYSSQYNEVLLGESDPCAMYIIGYGEKDLSSDYQKMIEISKEMCLPLVEIDMCTYRENQGLPPLGDMGKKYVAMQTIYSYYNQTNDGWNLNENKQKEIFDLIDNCSEKLGNKYLELRKTGKISKDSMLKAFEEIMVKMNQKIGTMGSVEEFDEKVR